MVEDPIIRVSGLHKSYGAEPVICDLSFSVSAREIVGLLGPNGAGKTTTIRLLNGVIRPDAGTISVHGLDPADDGDEIRRRSGVLTETAGLYDNLSGEENLRFFARIYPVDNASARIDELLHDFGLHEHRDKKVRAYSSGMKKRLGIARALLHDPEVLFLDEPTGGLDPEGARGLLSYIRNLNTEHGVTIFICTHLLRQVQDLCHRYIFIDEGRLLEHGSLRDLEEKYLGQISLRVETDLQVAASHFRGHPVVDREPNWLTFHLDSKEGIPGLLQQILAEADVYSAGILGRDLETLYFRIREREGLQ